MHHHHANRPALLVALVAAATLAVLALRTPSALLAEDALHAGLDLGSVFVGLAARRLAARGPDERSTFGWARVDALAGGMLALALAAGALWAAVGSWHASALPPTGILVAAAALAGAPALPMLAEAHAARRSATARALGLHGLADLAALAITLAAAALAPVVAPGVLTGLASSLVALAVVGSSAGMVREAARLSMDLAPPGVPIDEVRRTLEATPGVRAAHHLHLWRLDPDTLALSAHLVAEPTLTLHDTQLLAQAVRERLREAHGIEHATLEFECHACEARTHDATPGAHEPGAAGPRTRTP
jgi:cobalt-zinc-cadmium efflux system protein